jgi:hypothetical protein
MELASEFTLTGFPGGKESRSKVENGCTGCDFYLPDLTSRRETKQMNLVGTQVRNMSSCLRVVHIEQGAVFAGASSA